MVADWIARLKARTEGIEVKATTNLEQALADHRRDTLYVMQQSVRVGQTLLNESNQVQQIVNEIMSVVLAVSNHSDARGEAALTAIEQRRQEVMQALAGWTPTTATGPTEYAGGRFLFFGSNNTLWWQEEYLTGCRLEIMPA